MNDDTTPIIDEMLTAKQRLEVQIVIAIEAFEAETGMYIYDVDIEKHIADTDNWTRTFARAGVRLLSRDEMCGMLMNSTSEESNAATNAMIRMCDK